MLRKKLMLPLAALALGAGLALPLAVRAQDGDSDDDARVELRVKHGHVHVQVRTRDGRTLDRDFSPDELYRRLRGGDDEDELRLERELRRRLDQLHNRLERRHDDDGDEDKDESKSADQDDDDNVLTDIERTLRGLPDRLSKAFDELKKKAPEGSEKAKEIQQRIERTIEDALESIRGKKTDKVHVEVDGRGMDVPARKGEAKLY